MSFKPPEEDEFHPAADNLLAGRKRLDRLSRRISRLFYARKQLGRFAGAPPRSLSGSTFPPISSNVSKTGCATMATNSTPSSSMSATPSIKSSAPRALRPAFSVRPSRSKYWPPPTGSCTPAALSAPPATLTSYRCSESAPPPRAHREIISLRTAPSSHSAPTVKSTPPVSHLS